MFFSTTAATDMAPANGNGQSGNSNGTGDNNNYNRTDMTTKESASQGDAMKNCQVDFELMDELLDVTDKDTEYRRAWVAIRNSEESSIASEEDSLDLIPDDDNSVDYLGEAVFSFFRTVCSCDCLPGSPSDVPKDVVIVEDIV